MEKALKILIIEDHPLIVNAYLTAIDQIALTNKIFEFEIDIANDCDSAVLKIKAAAIKDEAYNLAFLDIKLPPSKDKKFLNGLDLGVLMREKLKNTKIIVSTMLNNSYIVSCILKKINPESFLIKSDLTKAILIDAINMVVLNSPYYSKSVIKILRKQTSNDFVIDDIDIKILYELSNGMKMCELPGILSLSIAALERRKRILKSIFNAEGKGDRYLLHLANEKGFI